MSHDDIAPIFIFATICFTMIIRFCKELGAIEIFICLLVFFSFSFMVYTNFDNIKCHSLQSEAKFALREIFATQMLYQSQKGKFATLDELLYKSNRLSVKQNYYDFYDAHPPGYASFKVFARGKSGFLAAGDVWSIDDNNQLINETNVCKK